MRSHQRIRPVATLLSVGILIVAGCSTTPASTTGAGGPTAAPPTTAAVVTPVPIVTEAPVLVLEDAGLETPMQAGTYTSRLFEPTLTLELDDSWFRRDAGDARRFNIRRGTDGGEDLTFFSGIDFIQCGKDDVVEQPDGSTAVDLIFGMPKLNTTQPEEVPVGDVAGTEIRLLGGGPGSFDDPLEDWLTNGCVISQGDVAFPGDSGWLVMLGSSVELYVFVETASGPVMIRARADDSTSDVEALWDYMREVIGTVQIG